MLESIRRQLVQPLSDFIYPPVCFLCNASLEEHEERICTMCWKSFFSIDASHPTWKEIKMKFEKEGLVQDLCSCFLFEKEGKLQDLIHLLKYKGITAIGVQLGKEIGLRFMNSSRFGDADFLVPIPLHGIKQRERGYNQSEYLCRGISKITNIPVHSALLLRTKHTVSQTKLNIDERKRNVEQAFSMKKKYAEIVEGKTFILVDDVITTGSTINACAKILFDAGAANVLAASAALAK